MSTVPICLAIFIWFLTGSMSSVIVRAQEDNSECAHVVGATAVAQAGSDTIFAVSATVSSTETAGEKYANEWRVQDENGGTLGTRVLLHDHVGEQPFTRSLSGVEIPLSIRTLNFTANDNVLGYCGDAFLLELKGRTGEDTGSEPGAPTPTDAPVEVDSASTGNSVTDDSSMSVGSVAPMDSSDGYQRRLGELLLLPLLSLLIAV